MRTLTRALSYDGPVLGGGDFGGNATAAAAAAPAAGGPEQVRRFEGASVTKCRLCVKLLSDCD